MFPAKKKVGRFFFGKRFLHERSSMVTYLLVINVQSLSCNSFSLNHAGNIAVDESFGLRLNTIRGILFQSTLVQLLFSRESISHV